MARSEFGRHLGASNTLYEYRARALRALKYAISDRENAIFGSSNMLYPKTHMGEFPGAYVPALHVGFERSLRNKRIGFLKGMIMHPYEHFEFNLSPHLRKNYLCVSREQYIFVKRQSCK